jgi:hypothetical protein
VTDTALREALEDVRDELGRPERPAHPAHALAKALGVSSERVEEAVERLRPRAASGGTASATRSPRPSRRSSASTKPGFARRSRTSARVVATATGARRTSPIWPSGSA